MSSSPIIHVLIAEMDASVAQSVSHLVLDVFPQDAEVLVGRTSTVAGAKRLLDRAQAAADGVVIVVCATELADGAGLDVLTYARRRHPTARIVLLTNGERDQLVVSLTSNADGIVAKPYALKPLRAILDYLSSDAPPVPAQPHALEPTVNLDRVELQEAATALETALEAVERAQDRLANGASPEKDAARRALRDVEILAVEAHRRFLEAEKQLGEAP